MMDVIKHRDRVKYHTHGFKHHVVAIIAIFALIVVAYYYLLESLGVNINGH